MLRLKAADSMRMPETVAHTATIQISATSVMAGHSTATTPAARSTTPSRISNPHRSPFRAALMPEMMANTPSTSMYAANMMTNTWTAMPGVSRQIRPKMMPRMPRRPTAHQLSARTSLNASQRGSDTLVRPFEDVLAAMKLSFLDQQVDQVTKRPEDANRSGAMMKPIQIA